MFFAHKDNTINDMDGLTSSIEFNSSGNPCIAFWGGAPDILYYTEYNGTSWNTEEVDSLYIVGQYPSLEFGGDGSIHISYFHNHFSRLQHAVSR